MAPAASSAWRTLVAPGMVTTVSPLKLITQFNATWATVTSYLAAISSMALISGRVRSRLRCMSALRKPDMRLSNCGSLWYFPLNRPRARGV